MARHKKITPQTHISEFPGHFYIDNNLLFCNFCNISVEWKRKSTVDNHVKSKMHQEKKRKTDQKLTQRYRQQTLPTVLNAMDA